MSALNPSASSLAAETPKRRIARHFSSVFALLVGVGLLVGGVTLILLYQLDRGVRQIDEFELPRLLAAQHLLGDAEMLSGLAEQMTRVVSHGELNTLRERIEDRGRLIDKHLQTLEQLFVDPTAIRDSRAAVDDLLANARQLRQVRDKHLQALGQVEQVLARVRDHLDSAAASGGREPALSEAALSLYQGAAASYLLQLETTEQAFLAVVARLSDSATGQQLLKIAQGEDGLFPTRRSALEGEQRMLDMIGQQQELTDRILNQASQLTKDAERYLNEQRKRANTMAAWLGLVLTLGLLGFLGVAVLGYRLLDHHVVQRLLMLKENMVEWPTRQSLNMRPGDGDELDAMAAALASLLATLAEKNSELTRLATTDELSGTANRRRFMEAVRDEIARVHRLGGPMALLLLDIDHFKSINDTHGHPVGDQVIRAIGRMCRAELRDVDTVGRIGGEEFAALLPAVDLPGALIVAERLRARMETSPVTVPDQAPIRFTASIGVTVLDKTADDSGSLLARADEALYEAKHAGRNCVRTHAPQMDKI